jgi:DNA-binding NarL/FixJ family response regulator
MPALDGAGVVEQVRARYPDARLVILTTYDADDDVERALRAGREGVPAQGRRPRELVACVRAVHAGRSWVSPAIAAKLAERLTRVELTPREMGVLRELATGKSNKEIAAALGIVEGTVKLHVTRLYEKLGVSSRTEALAGRGAPGDSSGFLDELRAIGARRRTPGLRSGRPNATRTVCRSA